MTGEDETMDRPIRKINPVRGILGVRYEEPEDSYWFEFLANMVRSFDRLKTSQVMSEPAYWRDPQDSTSGPLRSDWSMPGYTIFNARFGFRLTDWSDITLAVENLTDKKYRAMDSRMDASGLNFLAALTVHF